MSAPYPVPIDSLQRSLDVKKSRFIAYAYPVQSRDQAMQTLHNLKQQYNDARHLCWAYVLGNPAGSCNGAMNDDGEPSGTAGKPIMNVIQHKGIGNVMVIVVRYFGGIKLGAGGLTRAYSAAAEAVLSELPVMAFKPQQQLSALMDFSQEHGLRHQLSLCEAQCLSANYGQQVELQIEIAEEQLPTLSAYCQAHHIKLKQTFS